MRRAKNFVLSSCVVGILCVCNDVQKLTPTSIYSKDTTYFDKKLSEYEVKPCLFNLLKSVAKSNARFYDSSKFFYSLTLAKGNNQKYLNLIPEQWLNARDTDYAGILRIGEATFLCRGDFENDSLFKRNPSSIRVKLQQSTDSADIVPYFREPSLEGEFYDCNKWPIYLEIYTQARIREYEKMVHRSGIKREN